MRFRSPARLAVAAAALLSAGLPAAAQARAHDRSAVFVQTDNLAGNTIVAYARQPDGTLAEAAVYPTGGLGGQLSGSVVDHTASQGALALDRARGRLIAVNPGSDSISVFAVHGTRLSLREILPSGGSFPVSVATSGDLLYVANARGGGSVQGFVWQGEHLVSVPSWHRSLGLDTTLTPEFTHTPGQVAFTPDDRHLIVTTKANGNDIDVFAVAPSGDLSGNPTANPEPGDVPFAIAFDPAGHLAVTETGAGTVQTFQVNPDGTLTSLAAAPTHQAATCWVVADGSLLFASNTGSASLSGFSVDPGGALSSLGTTSTDPGTVDAAVSPDGRDLYVQTGANGIVDAFHVDGTGALTPAGSVTVPSGAGGEGIAVS